MAMKLVHIYKEKHEYFNEVKNIVLHEEIDSWHFKDHNEKSV